MLVGYRGPLGSISKTLSRYSQNPRKTLSEPSQESYFEVGVPAEAGERSSNTRQPDVCAEAIESGRKLTCSPESQQVRRSLKALARHPALHVEEVRRFQELAAEDCAHKFLFTRGPGRP